MYSVVCQFICVYLCPGGGGFGWLSFCDVRARQYGGLTWQCGVWLARLRLAESNLCALGCAVGLAVSDCFRCLA